MDTHLSSFTALKAPAPLQPPAASAGFSDIVMSVEPLLTAELHLWNDADLLHRIGQGDRRSFRIFYQRHAGRILVLLHQMSSDRVLAEDLVQEVFLLVWRKAASYRENRGEALGWLFTIARNKMIDYRRRTSARVEDEEQDLASWPASTEVHRDDRISLEQAISNLSKDQQRALRMTYYGGYTYEEAASRLQVPLGTLKSRIKSGLRRLRTAFESTLCL